MRYVWLILSLGGWMLAGLSPFPAAAQECPSLVWADEFDGAALDTSKWSHQVGDGCSIGLCGWGNNELEWYQPENATVSEGTLRITARREEVGSRSYTSSRIRTIGKGDWRFGRFEARLRLPQGRGIWPAFWMMPTDEVYGGWPQSGEIDIMENIGHERTTVHGTVHFGDPWPNNRSLGASFTLNPSEGAFADTFHTFAVEREPGVLRWFVDDVLYQTLTPDDLAPHPWPFDERFHFILNLAVGGNWPGDPDEHTVFPQTLEADYVRVYDGPIPYLSGARSVAHRAIAVGYTAGGLPEGTAVTWAVPPGATIREGQGTAAITVDWGEAGGDVTATFTTDCHGTQTLRLNVAVAPPFSRAFSFLNFDEPARIMLDGRVTGALTEVDNPDPSGVNPSARSGRYVRNAGQQYDVLFYDVDLEDAADYVAGTKLFYLDVLTDAPVGTEILLQLENGAQATATNYPTGRHSRYRAVTTVQNQWERLAFTFLDQPDPNTPHERLDDFVLLFAPDTFTGDTFYFDNFDSYAAGTGTARDPSPAVPSSFSLEPNYPNPFNPSTHITYTLPEAATVRLAVYDVLGKEIAVLVDTLEAPGVHTVVFDAGDLPSGLYVYRLDAGDFSASRVMTLLR